ncbi:5-formyltetrahydrofolate cyclo-ligase [Winogradskyella aurantiaca]|uniref:5-formyltetrahydrofolate cyclo-ligase n=1 Tax=Winogradskyella aurantiaca TaxID=2219558 RepID=UPI000E1D9268|nr:5-formyltetrahydrofolate cyclo-ligase [Winogradskyella aurantiaca]
MTKNELRKKYKSLRQALSEDQVEDNSLNIANQLLNLDIWNHSFYHIFLTITNQKEVNTDYILNILAGKDKHAVISKSNFEDYSMSHFLLSDDTSLTINSYGIPEPSNGIPIATQMIDVVLVPLLAYDTKGNRIGYGKGFYDRFLNECRGNVLKIGLSFFGPEQDVFEVDPNDIPLDICVTPDSVLRF